MEPFRGGDLVVIGGVPWKGILRPWPLPSGHREVNRPLPQTPTVMGHHSPKQQGQVTKDWNLWNCYPNHPFFLRSCLSQVFCHSDRKLTNTTVLWHEGCSYCHTPVITIHLQNVFFFFYWNLYRLRINSPAPLLPTPWQPLYFLSPWIWQL
jgi:hypothetical protein